MKPQAAHFKRQLSNKLNKQSASPDFRQPIPVLNVQNGLKTGVRQNMRATPDKSL